ncbi:hypothetical protein Lalb_Chr09g0332201 [Lupinus albus]|uniref:Uncharacterized protein n=1 Tax=Lupinus albus TaxID=3870 RepID=A0A6A4Q1W0_LUPAL|nr:hypothetical protein Lalb_Chr09g0332201 [Lupinus albus]
MVAINISVFEDYICCIGILDSVECSVSYHSPCVARSMQQRVGSRKVSVLNGPPKEKHGIPAKD